MEVQAVLDAIDAGEGEGESRRDALEDEMGMLI